MSENKFPNALQVGYTLHWYQIQKVLGQGAFGITYLAHDINLDRDVAIKEYMPSQLCTRNGDYVIQPLSEEHGEDFKWGLSRFINEARTLTRFEHPNLVRVFNVFEMNNTAYMVMNYEVGKSLNQIIKKNQPLKEKDLTKVLLPLMSGLELMHIKGFIHRDIKPGNIFIRHDGSPVLLDFGSARQTRGGDAHTLTNFVSPGYAPIEQYISKSDRQGPWTDIYGLGATLYKVITGVSPMNAMDRSEMLMNGMADDHKKLSELAKGRFSDKFLAAIDHALAFNVENRPHSIAEWREEFGFQEDNITTAPFSDLYEESNDGVTVQLNDADAEKTFAGNEHVWRPDKDADMESATINADEAQTEDVRTVPMYNKSPVLRFSRKHKTAVTSLAVFIVTALTASYLINNRGADKTSEIPETPAYQETIPMERNIIDQIESVESAKVISKSQPNSEPETSNEEKSAIENKIDGLLATAEEDLQALRLTLPVGNNAYEKYQQILEIDPQNGKAIRGLERIAERYVELAYDAMESDDSRQALRYLDKGQRVVPDSAKIREARDDLQVMLEKPDDDSDGNFFDGIKGWFKKNDENTKENNET